MSSNYSNKIFSNYFLVIISISIVLFLISSFTLIALNSEKIINDFKENIYTDNNKSYFDYHYLNNFKNRSEQGFHEKQKNLKNELISLFKNIAEGELEKEYLNLHTEMVKILTYFNLLYIFITIHTTIIYTTI